jgi:CHAT domain-containing protein
MLDGASGNYTETSEEVVDVLKKYCDKVTLYTADNCLEKNFTDLDSKPISVLHLSIHGFNLNDIESFLFPHRLKFIKNEFNQREYSGLVFSSPKDTSDYVISPATVLLQNANKTYTMRNDGILTGEDIRKINLSKVSLVCAATCFAGGQIETEDQTFGLRYALMMTGAHRTIVGLWDVNDAVADYFFKVFYENYLPMSFFSFYMAHFAYEKALLETRKKFPNPYYWAAFSLAD